MPALNSLGPTLASPVRPGQVIPNGPSNLPYAPVSSPCLRDGGDDMLEGLLELADGSAYRGISFGAEGKSISGECVIQTGIVGYTESLTDSSYEGQILVLTYPLTGNYGVPARPANEDLEQLSRLLAQFESSRIHAVGYYSEDFSHFLAKSSLGAWLKENGVILCTP